MSTSNTKEPENGGAKEVVAIILNDALQSDQENLLLALRQLSNSLQELDSTTLLPLSHYRVLPRNVIRARDLLYSGASTVHDTSTKYALLGTMDDPNQHERQIIQLTPDLRQACQVISTGCTLLHESGCSGSFRRHVKAACLAILRSVIQMIEAFLDGTMTSVPNWGAQKAGVVWESCNVLIERRIPMGNRNAIRRDLLTYGMECQETMDEFQQMVDLGPLLDNDERPQQLQQNGEEDDAWENFMNGQDQQYTSWELPIAVACLAIVKCSRGSINLTLQACDAVGAPIHEGEHLSDADQARLQWIEQLFQRAGQVGEGMTDVGSNMYPPLDLNILTQQIEQQALEYLTPLLEHVLNGTTEKDLPDDVVELATKLKSAISTRRKEALDAIAAALHRTQTNQN